MEVLWADYLPASENVILIHCKQICQFESFFVAAIYYIQWQLIPDWDGTRDEAILIWIIFAKNVYMY